MQWPTRRALAPVLLAAAAGGVLGFGAFTFSYGEGLSYFSTDPRACANCHIMNDQYWSWSRSPHGLPRRRPRPRGILAESIDYSRQAQLALLKPPARTGGAR